MSLLRHQALRTLARSRPNPTAPPSIIASASFHTTLFRTSESGKDAAEKESGDVAAKQRQQEVKDSKKNEQWKDALASESESAIKAERNETERDAKEDTEKLQRETEDAPRKKHGQ